jgi:hypothetical protein
MYDSSYGQSSEEAEEFHNDVFGCALERQSSAYLVPFLALGLAVKFCTWGYFQVQVVDLKYFPRIGDAKNHGVKLEKLVFASLVAVHVFLNDLFHEIVCASSLFGTVAAGFRHAEYDGYFCQKIFDV